MNQISEIIAMDNLRQAWEAVADNQGKAGVDDVSIKTWRRNWEERLVALSYAVRSNSYKPSKMRLVKIPKQNYDGFRILRIPTVTDRVLQRAASQILMPLFEPHFLNCSHGYRPGRGLDTAVEQILQLRDKGCEFVLRADIDDFFGSVDHELLLRFLQDDLPDESVLPLIMKWLEAGSPSTRSSKGISLGSPLSPLLANVFLHRLDLSLIRHHKNIVRYADDFVIFCYDNDSLQDARAHVEAALSDLTLRLEPSKSYFSTFDQGFTFIGVHFQRGTYSYSWQNREISVKGSQVDWLFSKYGCDYGSD